MIDGLEIKVADNGCDFLDFNFLKARDDEEKDNNALSEQDCLVSMMPFYQDHGSFF